MSYHIELQTALGRWIRVPGHQDFETAEAAREVLDWLRRDGYVLSHQARIVGQDAVMAAGGER